MIPDSGTAKPPSGGFFCLSAATSAAREQQKQLHQIYTIAIQRLDFTGLLLPAGGTTSKHGNYPKLPTSLAFSSTYVATGVL